MDFSNYLRIFNIKWNQPRYRDICIAEFILFSLFIKVGFFIDLSNVCTSICNSEIGCDSHYTNKTDVDEDSYCPSKNTTTVVLTVSSWYNLLEIMNRTTQVRLRRRYTRVYMTLKIDMKYISFCVLVTVMSSQIPVN